MDEFGFWICDPCSDVRHDQCEGAVVWCECYVEVLIEAEDMT